MGQLRSPSDPPDPQQWVACLCTPADQGPTLRYAAKIVHTLQVLLYGRTERKLRQVFVNFYSYIFVMP